MDQTIRHRMLWRTVNNALRIWIQVTWAQATKQELYWC